MRTAGIVLYRHDDCMSLRHVKSYYSLQCGRTRASYGVFDHFITSLISGMRIPLESVNLDRMLGPFHRQCHIWVASAELPCRFCNGSQQTCGEWWAPFAGSVTISVHALFNG